MDWTTLREEIYYTTNPTTQSADFTLNLSKSIQNYQSIDVYFKDDQSFSSVKRVYTGKSTGPVSFVLEMSKASAVSSTIFVSSRRCIVDGTTLTVQTERNAAISNNTYPTVQTSGNFRIYRVVGNVD